MLLLSDFDYNLPLELIAQQPAKPRDHSRLLLLDKRTGALSHRHFYDLPDYLRAGDVLVLNNSKVFPARLVGVKADTGGRVEIFLHQPRTGREDDQLKNQKSRDGRKSKADENIWECLVGGRVKAGLVIDLSKKKTDLQAVIWRDNQDGTWLIKFNLSGERFWRAVNKIGEVPLPPYIKRTETAAGDKNSYQTVFADKRQVGSAAAPTAGLHFTKGLLKKVRARGVTIVYVTLHVGLGTFAPVKVDNIKEHKMHSELASVSAGSLRRLVAAKKKGNRIVAVGTTSCRTLESLDWPSLMSLDSSKIKSQSFWTDIFIYPGYEFQAVEALVTNFHLPKSTLLMLVSALAGRKNIKSAYREAVERHYRFFSYGDAMLIY